MTILINTKLRESLLSYSFSHIDEDYHVRELAGIIGEDPGNLSRELRKLEEEGIYTSKVRGRLKIYSVNKAYPLFKEIRNIVFKTTGLEGTLRRLVNKYDGLILSFIYGSFAKQKEDKMSDIDMVIAGSSQPDGFVAELRKIESKFNREINYTFYKLDEFRNESGKEGSFLNIVLKGKKILLKGNLDDK
jgi:predicted nucleotidyltransferase